MSQVRYALNATIGASGVARLKPDWAAHSNFRRYLSFTKPLEAPLLRELAWVTSQIDCAPYERLWLGDTLVFSPTLPGLEPFILELGVKLIYAKTGREPQHDAALERLLMPINAYMRQLEHELGLEIYELGAVRCDDCGAHPKQRNNRMKIPPWPVASGAPCSAWTQPSTPWGVVEGVEPLRA